MRTDVALLLPQGTTPEPRPDLPSMAESASESADLAPITPAALEAAARALEAASQGDSQALNELLGLSPKGSLARPDTALALLRRRFCQFLSQVCEDACEDQQEAEDGMAALLPETAEAWDAGALFGAPLAEGPRRFLGLAIQQAEALRNWAEVSPWLSVLEAQQREEQGKAPRPEPSGCGFCGRFELKETALLHWLGVFLRNVTFERSGAWALPAGVSFDA